MRRRRPACCCRRCWPAAPATAERAGRSRRRPCVGPDQPAPTTSPGTAPEPEPRPLRPTDFDRRPGRGPPPGRHDRAAARHEPGVPRAVTGRPATSSGSATGSPPVVRRPGRGVVGRAGAAGESVNVVATPAGSTPAAAPRRGRPPRHGAAGTRRGGQRLGRRRAARGGGRCRRGRTRLPVVWVAFGAEEPRGPTDDDHHYGSRAYVAALGPAERRRCGGWCPSTGSGSGSGAGGVGGGLRPGAAVAARRRPAGRGAGVRRPVPAQQRPLVLRAGGAAGCPPRLHAVRRLPLAADLPAVVDPAQLERTGRLLLAWLAP